MRKGRSQRKMRSSRAPASPRSLPAVADAASAGGGRGPQVVVGIASPSSEQMPIAKTLDSGIAPVAEPVAAILPPALEVVAEPSLELVREPARLELADEPSPADERVELADEPSPADESPSPAAHMTSIVTPDEISIPPAGDLLVEPVAERFFSEGDLTHVAGAGEEETWEEGPASKAEQKRAPHVVERRARLARYVSWAVAGAAVLCLAAVGRSALMPASVTPLPRAAAVSALAAAPETALAPVVAPPAEPKAAEAPPAAEPKAAEAPPAAEPKAAETPPAAEPKVAPAEEAKPAVAPSDKTALEEKKLAQRALDRGKLADAIEAGERSVALDPTDGEAWLLLGAAYQEKGKVADARRAYTSCIKEGKRGPLGECRAMLR